MNSGAKNVIFDPNMIFFYNSIPRLGSFAGAQVKLRPVIKVRVGLGVRAKGIWSG